jgi:hypothetical protein
MAEMNPDGSSNGIDTSIHSTGNPIPQLLGGGVTVGHTTLILIALLALLWLLGGVVFRNVRM